jgi:hypothetical protein
MTPDPNPQPVGGADSATLSDLVKQLSLVLSGILTAARASTDTTAILKLQNEYAATQTLVNQAAQAQVAADDSLFGQAVTGLKAQATMLTDMEDQINAVVKDVETAATIVGYIAQAVTLIGRL